MNRNRKRRRRRRAAFGTYIMLIVSLLLLIGGVTMVVENWTASAQAAWNLETSDVSEDDWQRILVNRWHPIPENYMPELTELWNGESVDSRI